jgi:hypothetical protein
MSIAAALLLFVSMGILTARFMTDGSVQQQDDIAMSQEDALQYLQSNLSEFESEDLLALVDMSNNSLEVSYTGNTDEELEQYLEDNLDDFEEYLLTNEI